MEGFQKVSDSLSFSKAKTREVLVHSDLNPAGVRLFIWIIVVEIRTGMGRKRSRIDQFHVRIAFPPIYLIDLAQVNNNN